MIIVVSTAAATACIPIATPMTAAEICGRQAAEAGWQPDFQPTAARDVAIVGDSLTFGLVDAHSLEGVLNEDTGDRIVVTDGRIGCTSGERSSAVQWYADHRPDVLVIELGTNDVRDASRYRKRNSFASAPLAVLNARGNLRALTSYARARGVDCVVLVGVNEQATGDFDLRRFGPNVNDAMLTASRSDAVRYADWERISRSHPEWFEDDRVHLTKAGSDGLATLIADTVHTCREP